MRKTRLMQLAEHYGDTAVGASITSSTMDPVVYMISERAESLMGPSIIDALHKDISLTQCGFSRKRALEILTSEFIQHYLRDALVEVNVTKIADDIKILPPLSDKTYVDYFVTLTMLEHTTSRTKIARAATRVAAILAGYSTETAHPVCEGIVQFFKDRDDPQGCVDLIKKLCAEIKHAGRKRNP